MERHSSDTQMVGSTRLELVTFPITSGRSSEMVGSTRLELVTSTMST